jgi:hypothetical protein
MFWIDGARVSVTFSLKELDSRGHCTDLAQFRPAVKARIVSEYNDI